MPGTPTVLQRPCLSWGSDGWRVAGPDFWPARQVDSHGRTRIAPPRRRAPVCRLCGGQTHLCGRDRRPVHKMCVETAVYRAAHADGRLDGASLDELHDQTGVQAWLADLNTTGARTILAQVGAPAARRRLGAAA